MHIPHDELNEEVLAGGAGGHIGAFFDLDRTLLAGFSATSFMLERLLSGRMPPRELIEQFFAAVNFSLGKSGFSGLIATTARALRGMSEEMMIELGEEVFDKHLAADIYPESRSLVQAHLSKGHRVAIVSSATVYQIQPVARDLGIEHILCTRLEVKDKVFTGEVIKPTCWGEGKLTAVRQLSRELGLDLGKSYFYTDAHEDLPLLEAVGKPRPVNPDQKLQTLAAERNWPSRRYTSRGRPGPMAYLRTGLAWGTMVGSLVLAGLPTWLMTGSRRQAANVTMSTWGDLAAAFTGLNFRIEGEEHLWSQRPAVFMFNHQSGVDAIIASKLIRRDTTAIAKKETKKNPILGAFLSAAGVIFIDRFNREEAIKALQPAVQALREGISIAIAPEGTRSVSRTLGPFKKGGFHLAMQAGVPIVPIVIINAADAMPKSSFVIRPATIDIEVLPPIPTDKWSRESLDEHIADVRGLFLEVLGQQESGAPSAPPPVLDVLHNEGADK